MNVPTPTQEKVLRIIGEYVALRNRPPTLAELANEMGHAVKQGAKCHLVALEKKGFIRLSPRIAVGIEIVGLSKAIGKQVAAHVARLIEESKR